MRHLAAGMLNQQRATSIYAHHPKFPIPNQTFPCNLPSNILPLKSKAKTPIAQNNYKSQAQDLLN